MHHITESITVGSLAEAQQTEARLSDGYRAFLACGVPSFPPVPNILCSYLDVSQDMPWNGRQKEHAVSFVRGCLAEGRRMFVYSAMGRSRAPAAVWFWMQAEGMTGTEAMDAIREQFPDVRVHPAITVGKVPAIRVGADPSKMSDLSIVTVTYGRTDRIKVCLDRHMEQAPDAQIVVVDNGSDKTTQSYFETLQGHILLVSMGRNYGKGTAANIGFRLARGDWILYADSDVLMPADWIEEAKRLYGKIDNPGWITLSYGNPPGREGVSEIEPGVVFEEHPGGVDGGMVFMRRSVYEDIGGFLEDRSLGNIDTEYTERARAKGYRVGYVHHPYLQLAHLGAEDGEDYRQGTDRGFVAEHTMPPVDIVVVKYGQRELEEACIRSVRENTGWPYHLTVWDNFEAKESLSRVWNMLIEASPFEYVCLLNSDCEVRDGWLTALMGGMLADDRVALAGPSLAPESPLIAGFCMLIRKAAWSDLSGFDEGFGLYGQDTDFQIRLKYNKWVTSCYPAEVLHLGGGSTKDEIDVEGERETAHILIGAKHGKGAAHKPIQ
jgi:GT2 family glycosyltransferase